MDDHVLSRQAPLIDFHCRRGAVAGRRDPGGVIAARGQRHRVFPLIDVARSELSTDVMQGLAEGQGLADRDPLSASLSSGVILEGSEVDVRVRPATPKTFGSGTRPGG